MVWRQKGQRVKQKEGYAYNTGLAQLLWNLKLKVRAINKLKYSGTWEVQLNQ